ncbi:hypothetical protein SHKM778_36080 [Streptomyces sp. KM77-8]|uniref:Bacterial CdiA-CT RNAse A domain-containing protein n=1 Tax=Streptomyces haneummycinicus TaxID=3074435 RepID=A0AAT9HIM4_9ACTN
MVVVMTAAAIWSVLQLFAVAWPTRSVRLSTVLVAFAVGVYGCGVAAGLLEIAYTRLYADQSGLSLVKVESVTSYTVAPWVEELVKVSPLLLAGLNLKVRQQWGMADFVVVGAALGGGFGLLEAVLRFGLDVDRTLARDGGWIIPDSLFPPYVPSPDEVFTAWLPAPFGQLSTGSALSAQTFTHLVWTSVAGLGAGLLWRGRGWVRLLAAGPVLAAATHHTLTNYTVQNTGGQAAQWLETLDAKAWAAPLVCLAIAMVVDVRQLHRGKRTMPDVLQASERSDGDSVGALLRYAAWSFPWSLLIALRMLRLRRSLLYADAVASSGDATGQLRTAVGDITSRMDASDRRDAWRRDTLRARLQHVRPRNARRMWLFLIPCALSLPALLFLGVGSFTATSGLQEFFRTGAGPKILWASGPPPSSGSPGSRTSSCAPGEICRPSSWVSHSPSTASVSPSRSGRARRASSFSIGDSAARVRMAGPSRPSTSWTRSTPSWSTSASPFFSCHCSRCSLRGSRPRRSGCGRFGRGRNRVPRRSSRYCGHRSHGRGRGSRLLRRSFPHAWPRNKRKGPVKPRHRADLKGDEGKNGSHTFVRHVKKTTRDMRRRLRNEPHLDADSRFLSEADAQRFADKTLLRHQKRIENWLQGKRSKLRLDAAFDETTGLHLTRYDFKHGSPPQEVRSVRVILKRDPDAPAGYRVLTSFPTP